MYIKPYKQNPEFTLAKRYVCFALKYYNIPHVYQRDSETFFPAVSRGPSKEDITRVIICPWGVSWKEPANIPALIIKYLDNCRTWCTNGGFNKRKSG